MTYHCLISTSNYTLATLCYITVPFSCPSSPVKEARSISAFYTYKPSTFLLVSKKILCQKILCQSGQSGLIVVDSRDLHMTMA